MKTFLDQLAEEILKSGESDFSTLCVVLPNRRAGVFLRDALSRNGKRAIWAPKILSIEDFVFQLSGRVKIDQTTLLFAFYEVYKHKVKDPQSLEMFANWAPTFLSDINELDINVVDAQDVFKQLSSVERIAKWNPDGRPISKIQQDHINFVETFHEMYLAVRRQLETENKAYQGMTFRKVADEIATHVSNCEWSKVWFAGFNALTVSEEVIIQGFLEEGQARVFWDMDQSYADDPIHEAGFYLRKYRDRKSELKVDPTFLWKSAHLSSQPKEIHVIGAQRSVAQAEAASSILNEKLKSNPANSFSNTAVVLNDEKVLLPLLNSLPTKLSGVNITMGYGLRYSQSVVFVDKLFQLYETQRKDGQFYHSSVIALITDSIYSSVSGVNLADVRHSIVKNKKSYLSLDDIGDSEFDNLVFGLADVSITSFLQYLKKVTAFLRESWTGNSHILESKFLTLIERMIIRLSDLQFQFGGVESLKTLHVFWRQLINNQSLDFVGEPLGGLQVMGMLETRNLDFEELIILGVNEGNLPSNSHSPSNFTFDIRRAFGLACQNERDAVTAYHFYRLIQRAKKVYLIYDQDTTSFGGGEVSRYVQQLEMEAPPNIRIKKWGIKQDLPKEELRHEISIAKGAKELEKLKKRASNGISPSALNTYRTCPLKFYFRYVAGFREPDELNEEVDHATFGTAVHDTLERLYTPFIDKQLTEDGLRSLINKIESELEIQFAEQVAPNTIRHGKNLLAFEVAKMYVKRVIDHDHQQIKTGKSITPLSLEQKLRRNLRIETDGSEIEVYIEGLADRIDKLSDGTIRVIDYKTGSFDKTKDIKREQDFYQPKSDNAFQLLLYGWMYDKMNAEASRIDPTVFFLRSKEIEQPITIELEKEKLTSSQRIEFTDEYLRKVLSDLFDQEISFYQTDNADSCQYCDFKHVCQR